MNNTSIKKNYTPLTTFLKNFLIGYLHWQMRYLMKYPKEDKIRIEEIDRQEDIEKEYLTEIKYICFDGI